MNFAFLSATQLGMLFAAVATAVVVLYVLKLRRRVVQVPFAPLWQRVLRDKEATSLFSKLKRLLSLLLQLVLLGLLVLALGDPRATASIVKARTLVVLVDASASMQATDVFPTRIDVAKQEVRKLVRSLGASDRMLIVQMDAMVTPLGPMSGDVAELERSLDGVRASDSRADFPRALRFAVDALRGADGPEIVVVSDGNLGPAADASGSVRLGDTKLALVTVGKSGRNAAITQFAVRRYPLDRNRYEVMIEIANTGAEPEDLELSLFGDRTLVDLARLHIGPGERVPRFYPNLSGAARTLEARLQRADGTRDELPADDRAYALLPERRRAKVLVVSEGNTYLEAALLLDEYLDVSDVRPKDFVPSKGDRFDVVIFDRVTPLSPPRTGALYLDPRGPGSPVKVGDELKQPGFDKVDRKHPLARFIALEDVNVAAARKLLPEPADRIVGASNEGPFFVAGTRAGYKFIALGFDVRESDLPLRAAWPLFIVNAMHWFTDDDASYLSSFRTGEVWRIPVAAGATHLELKTPSQRVVSVPVHEGRAVYLGQQAGFYELVSAGAQAASSSTAFAANLLDEAESTIAPQVVLTVDGKRAGAVTGAPIGVRREVWIYLLFAVVLLTALEWATYHRRVTV